MGTISTLNGLEIVDETARKEIEDINNAGYINNITITSDGEGNVTLNISPNLVDGNEVAY